MAENADGAVPTSGPGILIITAATSTQTTATREAFLAFVLPGRWDASQEKEIPTTHHLAQGTTMIAMTND